MPRSNPIPSGRESAPPPWPRPALGIREHLTRSFQDAARHEHPFRHWTLTGVFGAAAVDALARLPFPVANLGGVSGARDLHNKSRQYFDPPAQARHAVCRQIAEAFQSPDIVSLIGEMTGASLGGCGLRIEYAQDVDGFWLAPHTDLGVKRFTMLYAIADDEDQATLGTDMFDGARNLAKRTAFRPDTALVFVPSSATWHGFLPRPISGVRKSVIVNYVTGDWRATEELSFPDTPVRTAES